MLTVMKSPGEQLVQNTFADMSEWSVTKIMPEPDGLYEIFVEIQSSGYRPTHLRNLDHMSEPGREVITDRCYEHLAFVLEPSERVRVDYPVTVTLEGCAHRRRLFGDG